MLQICTEGKAGSGEGGQDCSTGAGGEHLSSQAPGQPPPLVYPVQCLRLCTLGGGDEVQGGGVESALSDEGQASSRRALWEPLAAWRLRGGQESRGAMQLCSFNCTPFPRTTDCHRMPLGPKAGGGVKGRGRLGTNIRRSVRGGGSARGEAGGSATGPRHSCQGGGSEQAPPTPRPSKGKAIPFLCQSLLHSPSRGRVPLRGLRLLEEAWQGPAPAKWPRCASGRPPGSLGAASAPSSCAGSGAGTA